ncbi:MAG: hypothetical protein II743_10450, partial [Lachnospiraceae bacterium]|nr:hypothetical protein [Lachnospiraceae bacterium]
APAMTIERIKTGLRFLDDAVGGVYLGLPALVKGARNSGKTKFFPSTDQRIVNLAFTVFVLGIRSLKFRRTGIRRQSLLHPVRFRNASHCSCNFVPLPASELASASQNSPIALRAPKPLFWNFSRLHCCLLIKVQSRLLP